MVLESNTLDVLFVKDGQQGEDGKILYTWIKYAKDASGTGITDDPNGAIYIGISYNNESSIESNDPTHYAWTKIQGADGKKGEDAYTIVLENENISFATDENRNPLSEQAYTSRITVMRGATPVTDFGIGDIAKTQGIAIAKGDDGISISVVNGNPLHTDSGEITVPISVGGTVFKKVLTWTCAKKGEQGVKGDTGAAGKNGTSVTITSKSVTYQTSTSGTTTPTGTWQATVPTVANGQYLWTKTTVQYSDGNKTEAYGVSYKGTNGQNGSSITVSKNEVTYQVSTSGTTTPTGTWSTTMPSCDQGQYLWTKTYVKYSDGKETTSYSVSYRGVDGADGQDGNSFAWNMLSETNCGKKHWGTVSSGGKYSVESETTEDNIEAVKLICTESVSSSGWSYTCFTDLEMLKQLKPSTKYTLSYDIKANRSGMISHTICRGNITNSCTNTVVVSNIIGDETWQHISVVLTTNDLKITPTNEVVYLGRTALSKVGYSIIKNLKLTEGYIDTPWSPSQSDIEGKGIAQIVQYYLATSQATGVTSSTSGWSTDITTQKITATKKYLWNCSQTRYTDGTSEPITTPTIIGAYGDKGETGADGQDGAGFHWNLLKYSGDLSKQVLGGAGTYTATVESIEDKTTPSGQAEKITYTVQGTGGKFIQTGKYIKEGNIKQGKTYTVSVWCKCSSIKSTGVINAEFLDNKTYVNPTLSTEWQQYVVTGVANKDVTSTSSASAISFYYNDNMSVGDIFYISSPKVEEGDKASPWCTTYEETLAKNLTITPSAQIFKSTDGGNTFAPNQITITPTLQGDITFGKWQYSIDGGVSFADVVSGQSGLSVDTNKNLTIAKTSGLFTDKVTMVTFRAVASDSSFYDTCSIAKLYDVSDIGDGRNLLWNSNFAKTDEAINTSTYTTWGLILRGNTYTATIDTSVKHNNFNTLKVIGTKAGENGGQDLIYRIKGLNLDEIKFTETGVKYTLSFYAKASIACNFSARYAYDSYAKDTNVALSTDWKRYEIQMHPTTTSYQTSLIFKMDAASTVWFSEFKLEKGSSATGYSTAPEDVQTAILSTKSEISDVSSKVDNNKQAIEQRVEKTTYQQDLKLVKGDISKANEGLNKWRYEIYPKSLFASEYQGKSTMDVFAKNTNLTPSQSVLINDTDLSIAWNYDNNYIGYALTFVKFSAAKSVAITFAHDDGAHIYLNGKLIGGNDVYNNKGESLTLGFVKGWNCIEVVVNEGASTEGFKLGTTLSALSECQLMNCYYGTPVARQSHITNQLVQNTTDIDGVSTKVSKVTSVIGDNGENFTSFKNDYSDFKLAMDGFKTTVGKTYVTKDDFNGLEIGGVNLFVKSTASRGWWISDTGVLNANGGWGYSDYIDVSGMKNYIASGFTNLGISPATCFYDSNKTFISGVESKNQNSQDSKRKTLPIPSNAKYMRFSFALADINTLKIEQGTKATVYSPSPYDDEINGQNLVSNLPANWEQGTVTEGSAVGTTYANTKSASAGSVRPKELIPVSGNITISTAYSNQSKKPIRHWIAAYDVNKNYLGNNYVSNAWNSFPRTLDMKDAKYIAIMVGYTDSSAITPSDISQICLKIERGTSATPFTLAPEDVNGKIQSVETIATQTATEIGWLINRNGSTASSLKLTENALTAIAENINLTGRVKFSSLSTDAKQGILNSFEVGGRNLALNTSNSYSTAFTSFSGVENTCFGLGQVTCKGIAIGDVVTVHLYIKYTDIVPASGQTARIWTQGSGNITVWNDGGFGGSEHKAISGSGEFEFLYSFTMSSAMYINTYWDCALRTDYIASGSIQYKAFKVEKGNKATDWTPAPEDVSQDATNKASQALTDANNYSSSAVNWVTNNGSSTTSLNSMVKKWTDGAVSDTTQINGGWIKTNTITANKIAIGDFTNYADINESNTYWFRAEQTKEGTWFYRDGSELQRDNVISELHTCRGGEKFYVEYDISNTIKEGDEYKYAGLMIFGYDGNGGIVSYNRNAGVTATANGEITHITTQLTMPDTTRSFRVYLQIEGHVPFTGTLKIRNISVRKAVTGNLIVDGAITADKIATDAIKSRNYISSGGTQGSFLNLSDGSFKSPNLSWDSNGNLIASNANLSGLINATKGTVGGWNIATNGLYSGIDENAIKIYSATTYDAQTMYQKQKIQDSFILSQKYINHFVSQQVSVGHNIPYWQTRSFIYNDSQIQLAQSDYCINTSSASNYDAQYSLKDGYISATRIYMEQNITQVGGDVINSSFSIGLDSMMGWCSIQSTKGINIYGNSSRALYVQSNDTSKYNALETEGDVVVNGKIHAVSGDNKIQLNSDNNGSIELYGNTPFIDFHSAYSSADYTCRIIANTPEQLLVCGKLRCDSNIISNNDLIANSWVYAGQNAHYTWQNQLDCYFSCGYYNNTNNVYYYAGYHAFYVNGDSGSGMMYIETSGVSSRKGFRNSSDERIKQNFSHFDDNFIDTYMSLEPVQYQFKNDTNDKYHFGFKAQQTERILNAYGQESDKSYGICATHAINPEKAEKLYGVKDMHEEYTLAYDELIAPTTYMVQHTYKELESTKNELEQVKQEKADLETRLQAIEAKLGL